MNLDILDDSIDVKKVLDVTAIEPRRKHPTIFEKFDSLQAGDYFVIHNDHDPKPLYYQLLGERGNIFTFEYLSKGPEVWLIKIQKNSAPSTTAADPAQPVSKKATKTAANLAAGGKDHPSENTATPKSQPATAGAAFKDDIILQYDQWNPGFLSDFIEQTDHRYFREQVAQLDDLGELIRQKHQKAHPELASLKMYQDQLFSTLLFHLDQEKSALFDAIKQIEASQPASEGDTDSIDPVLLTQLSTGRVLKTQGNDSVAGLLEQIRKQTSKYQAPSDACDSYIYYFKRLSQLDLRISRYLHLENTVLLPSISKWL